MKFKYRQFFYALTFFSLSGLAAENPWEGNLDFEGLNEKINLSFPLKGKSLRIVSDLISYEGYKGNVSSREEIGNELFCDFQLKEDHMKKVLIKGGRELMVENVEGYLASDLEISRVGVVFKFAEKTLQGEKNPFDFLICIRNQQRDQIPEGWTLEREAFFDRDEIVALVSKKIDFN
jgi:hypothetical protein